MSICKECSNEVTTVDQFCPFCGIRMEQPEEPPSTPVQSGNAAETTEAEMDSTIVISPAELEDLRKGAAVSDPAAGQTPAAPARNTSPSVKTDPHASFDEVPSPSILTGSNIRPTDPGVSLDAVNLAIPMVEEPVAKESVALEPILETPLDEPQGLKVVSEAVGPEPEVVAEVPILSEEASIPDLAQPAGSFEEPAEPILEASLAEVQVSLAEVQVDEESPSAANVVEPNTSNSEDTTAPSIEGIEEIVRPSEELVLPEKPPSVFDSVRIIEEDIPEHLAKAGAAGNVSRKIGDEGETMIPGRSGRVSSRSLREEQKATGAPLGGDDSDARKAGRLKPLPEGNVLNGRYEIVRKIGGGGMGAVYLASDNNLGGVLRAVKEMVQAHIEEEQQVKAINDFKRESMILSTLDHPSIPTIFDYFCEAEEGRFYLVMKYISGGDLAGKLRAAPEGKIDELTVTEWAIQVTDVLNYLHNQPTTIVYRDLKPSNLMLDGNSSRIMLIDFGIARSISQKEEKGVTAVGTMGYAPPELFSGNVEPRSDIYSLGSTMFHLLTGADPQSNPLLIFDFQKNPRPRQINSRLSDQMERILMKAVEYNADGRYSTAAEMKAVLEDHLNNLRTGNLTFGVTEAPISVSLANQSVFCGFCGQRIVATDLFCAFCGAKQPLGQQGVHSEIYRKSAQTARLVIEGTSDLSAPTYSLQKDDNLIGRRDPMSNIFPEVDLSKFDPQTKISRRHAKIWKDGTSFMLEDLGSSNGTIVEGSSASMLRLPAHQPYKLSSGDRIRIGDTRLHFVVG